MRKLAIILFIVAAILFGLWLAASRIASHGIIYVLKQRHIPVHSLEVASVSRNHLRLTHIALGDAEEIRAAKADVTIGWQGDKAERFDIILSGADVTVTLQGGQVLLGGVERAWSKLTASGTPTKLHITGDATIHYETDGTVTVDTKQSHLDITQEGKTLLVPLMLDANVKGNLNQSLAFTGKAASDRNALQLAFHGSYDILKKQGDVDWSTKPITFSPDGFTFADLSPAYAADVDTFPMRVSAKGKLRITDGSWTLTPNLTFHELALAPLLGAVLGEGGSIDGSITGALPLIITPDHWRIQPAMLRNQGGLKIALSPDMAAAGMIAAHPQAKIVTEALSNFEVETMTLSTHSTDNHGGVSLVWHFLGRNPKLYGGKKIDFTLAVDANLEDIWLGATKPETLVKKAHSGDAP